LKREIRRSQRRLKYTGHNSWYKTIGIEFISDELGTKYGAVHAGCKDGTVANDKDIDKQLNLYVGPKVTNDVSLDRVLADVVLGSPEASKDSITGLNSTTDLSSSLPDHLREVGRLGVVGVIFRDFIGPGLDSRLDAERAGASGKILAQGAEGSARVLVLALVSPLLGFFSGGIAPCNRHSAVLGTDRVVCLQVRLHVAIRRPAAVSIGAAAAAAAPSVSVVAVGVGVAVAVRVAVRVAVGITVGITVRVGVAVAVALGRGVGGLSLSGGVRGCGSLGDFRNLGLGARGRSGSVGTGSRSSRCRAVCRC
jgi:hypothetical protein